MALKRKSEDQETQSPAKKSRVDSNTLLLVVVSDGSTQEDFRVNKNDIRNSPILLKKIVQSWSWWTWSQSHTITIMDHHPDHFDLYHRWLMGREMSGQLPNLRALAERVNPSLLQVKKAQQTAACLDFMVKSWFFGDYLEDTLFKDAIVSTIMHLGISDVSHLPESIIITIATKCDVASGLFDWLVETLLDIYSGESIRDKASRWPHTLRDKMLERYMAGAVRSPRKKKSPSKVKLSMYEEHTKERR